MSRTAKALDQVREYYGKVLRDKRDLRSSACCTDDAVPGHHREILDLIDDEILERSYGCGSPIPDAVEGCTVLDLGCGTGRDSYLLSHLVGPRGRVIGIDMTDEQLEVARRHIDNHTRRFGYAVPNVEFRQGYIENLREPGIADESVDVVVSNCVINLSPDKEAVFSEILRVLKPGGELYFADVVAGRRVPESVREDPVLHGECLGGAMYIEDFRRLLRDAGIPDYRVVASRPIELRGDIEEKAGMVDFYAKTIRAFKLDNLEDICEDYGQTAVYRGSITGAPHAFILDDHHIFATGKAMMVCGNTAAMLEGTRLADHFDVVGDRSRHYGPFDCAPMSRKLANDTGAGGACC